jgi:hypothetical protein
MYTLPSGASDSLVIRLKSRLCKSVDDSFSCYVSDTTQWPGLLRTRNYEPESIMMSQLYERICSCLAHCVVHKPEDFGST